MGNELFVLTRTGQLYVLFEEHDAHRHHLSTHEFRLPKAAPIKTIKLSTPDYDEDGWEYKTLYLLSEQGALYYLLTDAENSFGLEKKQPEQDTTFSETAILYPVHDMLNPNQTGVLCIVSDDEIFIRFIDDPDERMEAPDLRLQLSADMVALLKAKTITQVLGYFIPSSENKHVLLIADDGSQFKIHLNLELGLIKPEILYLPPGHYLAPDQQALLNGSKQFGDTACIQFAERCIAQYREQPNTYYLNIAECFKTGIHPRWRHMSNRNLNLAVHALEAMPTAEAKIVAALLLLGKMDMPEYLTAAQKDHLAGPETKAYRTLAALDALKQLLEPQFADTPWQAHAVRLMKTIRQENIHNAGRKLSPHSERVEQYCQRLLQPQLSALATLFKLSEYACKDYDDYKHYCCSNKRTCRYTTWCKNSLVGYALTKARDTSKRQKTKLD